MPKARKKAAVSGAKKIKHKVAKETVRTRRPSATNPLAVYILLDRSGSMNSRWVEAISSINSYVDALKLNSSAVVTLATFDQQHGFCFDIVRDAVPASGWRQVTSYEVVPRGGTPLYDAFARMVGIANARGIERSIVVVMTDGYENASVEVNQDRARQIVGECQAKNWQVIFLGADFDAFQQAAFIGVNMGQTLNMARGFYVQASGSLAECSLNYAATGDAVNFSDEDRLKAQGSPVPSA